MGHRFVRAGAVAFSVFVSTGALALPVPDTVSDQVGATPGEFRVDESGSATYSVPLYAAPGTAGVVPQLALAYSSQGGDGPVGKGWSIAGMSSIIRCRASREAGDFISGGAAIDGDPGPISFGSADRFCLDGQRLIPAPGGAPACPAVSGMGVANLRTELESWSRVCAYTPSLSTNGPAFFTVDRKDGSTAWYGDRSIATSANRPDGYIETNAAGHETKAIAWSMTRFQDSTGNYIDYTYLENPAGSTGLGEHLLSEVRYTGKLVLSGQTGTALATYAKVVFNYSVLPTASWSRGYQSGAVHTRTRRLDSITSSSGTDVLRHYQLDYQTSVSGSGVPILSAVQECRDATLAVCLSPTVFVWSQAANEFYTADAFNVSYFGDTTRFNGFKLGDVDGDGRQDMVWLKNGTSGALCPTEYVIVAYGGIDSSGRQAFLQPEQQTASTRTCTTTELSDLGEGSWFLIDYDGDGRDDIFMAGAVGSSWVIRPSVGRATGSAPAFGAGNLLSTLATPIPGTNSEDDLPQLADLNGDGLLDLVQVRNGGTYARLMERQTGTPIYKWGNERTLVRNGMSTLCSGSPGSGIGCSVGASLYTKNGNSQLLDLNADARADVLYELTKTRVTNTPDCEPQLVDPGTSSKRRRASTKVGLECERTERWTYLVASTVTSITATQVTVDLYGAWLLTSYDDLGGFGSTTTYAKEFQFGDINGDGLSDAVYANAADNWHYVLNIGTGFLTPIALGTATYDDHLKLLDVNGDGRADIVYPVNEGARKVFKARFALSAGGFGAQSNMLGNNAAGCVGSSCDIDAKAHMFGDFDGDGVLDFFTLKLDTNPDLYTSMARSTFRYRARDVITRISNGFGANTDITYRPLTIGALYRADATGRTLAYGRLSGVQDILAPSQVVAWVSSSSPIVGNPNAMATVFYRYAGAKAQAGGRGFLGFREITTFDANFSGTPAAYVATTTQYRQDFPFIGTPSKTSKRKVAGTFAMDACLTTVVETCFGQARTPFPALGGVLFSDNDQSWISAPAFAGGTQVPLAVQPQGTTEVAFDPGSGTALSRITTAFTHDAWGNVATTSVSTSTGASALVSTVATTNVYTNDGPRWRLGRLATSSVTHSRPSQPNIVRSTSFAYDMAGAYTGQLLAERTQPGSAVNLDLRKLYTLDAFGNRTQLATCTSDITDTACRAAAIAMQPAAEVDGSPGLTIHRYARTTYDVIGRYPVSTTEPFRNASNAVVATVVQTVLGRDVFGSPTHTRNALGVDAMAVTGTLGRPYYTWSEAVANSTPGTSTQGVESWTTYRWCGTGTNQVTCPSGAVFRQQMQPEGSTASWTYYDKLGRAMLAATQTFNAGITGMEFSGVCSFWDVQGKPERISNPFFFNLASVAGTPNVPANQCDSAVWNRTYHDVVGRAVRSVFGDTTEVSTSYSDLSTTLTDQLGHSTVEVRNALGEKTSVTDAAGLQTIYSYDAAGNLLQVSRDAGRGAIVSSFGYDVLGRKSSQNDPDSGAWSYAYNAAGELRIQVDGKGQAIHSFHDARGRIHSRKIYTTAGALESQYTYTFDTGTNGLGNLESEAATGIETTSKGYAYDTLGRPGAASTVIGGVSYALANTRYDTLGRVVEVQDATGRWQRSEFTPLGFAIRQCEGDGTGGVLCTINGPNTYQQTNTVDARGNVLEEKRGGAYVKRSFDVFNGRLLRTCTGKTIGSADCTLQDETYTWDNRGSLLSRQRGSLYTEHFAYDAANRVTKAWFSKIGALTYGIAEPTVMTDAKVSDWLVYDKLGNLCLRNFGGLVVPYTYAGRAGCGTGGLPGSGTTSTFGAHGLTGWWDYGITRDANGNQAGATYTGSTVKGYGYTAQNQARTVWNGGSEAAATQRTRWWYGPDGGRYKRIDDGSNNGGVRTTLTLGNVERIVLGSVVTWRRSLAGGLIQTLTGATPVAQHVRTLLHDHIGSIVAVADAAGNLVETADHGVFGSRRGWVGSTQLGATNLGTTDRGYTGHEQVGNLDTIHMNGRIYDPAQGRFLQTDPVVQNAYNPQNWNPFSYGYNNPLANTDPTGMMTFQQALGMVVGIVFAVITQQYWAIGNIVAAFGSAVAGGFFSAAISTGSLKAGLQGAFAAGLTFGIGWAAQGLKTFGQVAAQGLGGGIVSELQGGKFGHGFASAGLTALAMPAVGKIGNGFSRSIVGAMIGGTISEATGGKFANGAIGGAVQGILARGTSKEEFSGSEPSGISDRASKNRRFSDNISVACQDSSCDVTFSLAVGGDSTVTDETVEWVARDIEEVWAGTYSEDGVTYNVRADVSIDHARPDILVTAIDANKLRLDAVYPGGQAVVGSGNVLEVGWWHKKGFAAHEFGHLIGLRHQANATNSIMSYSTAARLTWSDVHKVATTYD